jgi:phosphoglycolate phosphatase-like HAD superfamily hydrolase
MRISGKLLKRLDNMTQIKPLYIFDLDGTLALNDHRQYLLPNWNSFYKECMHDKPNESLVRLLRTLWFYADIWIWSGRSDMVYYETMVWLSDNVFFNCESFKENLKMRKNGDYTPDEELKSRWYDNLSERDKKRLICIFDDRNKVVDMWRSKGIVCCQVAKGDF